MIRRILLFTLTLFILNIALKAQCTAITNVAYYKEDFETNNGNWINKGSASDWAWGTPGKSLINKAGSGQKCWITGGLTNAAYNSGQRSWIESPCFDFTNLQYPYISFKVYWETENNYDGAGLQYSTDNGISWQNLGNDGSPPNCMVTNWFNNPSINNLSQQNIKSGWSGTVKPSAGSCNGGNGSAGWVSASHTMLNLAGKPSVKFRFTFGAGTTCNTYDGFAVDDIYIGTAPPNAADFTTTCIAPGSISFINTSILCPVLFSWNFGDPTSGAANTSSLKNPQHTFSIPGSYSVTLTVTGPANAPSTIVKEVYIMDVNATIFSPIKCFNSNDGSAIANLNVTPGSTAISYSWNTIPVNTNQTVTGLGAGTYTVVVTPALGCPDSASVTLVAPPKMNHTVVSTNANCNRADGTASITETGGIPPYTYAWNPNVSTTSSSTTLLAGNYIVSVTDSLKCVDTIQIQIASISSGLVASILWQQNVTCNGGSDGSIAANATGIGPFSYSWLPFGGNSYVESFLPAGTYQVVVIDALGCSDTATAILTQPNPIVIKTNVINTICGVANGQVDASVISGGNAPFTYLWTPGNYPVKTIGNLPPGTYTVFVTDATGCFDSAKAIILPSSPPFIVSLSHTDVLCNGQQNGTAFASTILGTPPYKYVWTNGSNNYTGNPLTGVGAGTYNVVVTDSFGCANSNSVTINEPLPLTHVVAISPISCTSTTGSATIVESGGTAPYTFSWFPSGGSGATASGLSAGNYVVTIIDSNNCIDTIHIAITNNSMVVVSVTNLMNVKCYGGNNASVTLSATGTSSFTYQWWPYGGSSNVANNLSADTFIVKVIDASGCIGTTSLVITQPDSISKQITATPTTCGNNNGGLSVQASGGTGSLTYLWSPGNFTTSSIINQPSGIYSLTIKDSNGCSSNAQPVIGASSKPSINGIVATKPLCSGQQNGVVNATVSNGIAPYTFSWTNGVINFSGNPLQNIVAGKYVLTVTDAANCTTIDSVTITEPAAITHSSVIKSSTCSDANGSASLTINGGTLPYSFQWSNPNISGSSPNNLLAGNYVATIKDGNGCIDTVQVKVDDIGSLLVAIANNTNVTCYGGNNGSSNAVISGGVAPFVYSWSPSGGNANVANNLVAGTYTITATGQYGCKAIDSVKILQPLLPITNTMTVVPTNCGIRNGSVTANVNGGTAPYSYNWSPIVSINSSLNNLVPGRYYVTIVDAANCIKKDSADVSVSIKPTIDTIIKKDVLCYNQSNGFAYAKVIGGVLPYQYYWQNGTLSFSGDTISNIPQGTYQLMVKDFAGCTDTSSVIIAEPQPINLEVETKSTSCGVANGKAKVKVVGGTSPFKYAWSNGSNLDSAVNLQGGVYQINITDANNCILTNSNIWIPKSNEIAITLGNDTTICPNEILTLSPGKFAQYTWQDNSTLPSYQPIQSGTYRVVVVDTNNCVGKASIKVALDCQDIVFPTAFSPDGNGKNDQFGPLGTLSAVRSYHFNVYNRWGQLVFTSTNPYNKWNGKLNGADAPIGAYVWMAEYTFNGQEKKMKKGTVVIVR